MKVEPVELDDRWILSRRGRRNDVDAREPYAHFIEPERTTEGRVQDVLTVFITNKTCPFRCLMCDLWKNTTVDRAATGAVASQVGSLLKKYPDVAHVKLYNAGNFFDDQAISRTDRARIANLVSDRQCVIVECHPRLVDRRCIAFADAIEPKLHVAMGLETVDPEVLPRLNKRMTVDDFGRAASLLADHEIPIRAFILLRAPFQSESAGVDWARRSIDYAFSVGVECCAVVPTRAGNGAMDELQRLGHFHPPSFDSIEAVLDYGVNLNRGRVFMDLWDIENFATCSKCRTTRTKRLEQINLTQGVVPRIPCEHCSGR